MNPYKSFHMTHDMKTRKSHCKLPYNLQSMSSTHFPQPC